MCYSNGSGKGPEPLLWPEDQQRSTARYDDSRRTRLERSTSIAITVGNTAQHDPITEHIITDPSAGPCVQAPPRGVEHRVARWIDRRSVPSEGRIQALTGVYSSSA